MRNLNLWTYLRISKLKLKINLARKLKFSNLTEVVNTMADMMDQVNNVHLQKFLEECGIIPQYIRPRKPSMNGVAKRQNRTLKDMVRCMISRSFFLESLWGEALKTVVYILKF